MNDTSDTKAEQAPPDQTCSEQKRVGLWEVCKSVSASFFGVQSSANRERDFKHGKAHHFIIIGVVMTAVFIFAVVMAVKLALSQAGV